MRGRKFRIGVVAPASRLDPAIAEKTVACADSLFGESAPEIVFHPQCFLSSGHFAGDDAARTDAFVGYANDEEIDAIWFARGGYGSNRIVMQALPKLTSAARGKTYLGYSDIGFLLAGLYGAGFSHVAHGPVVADIAREKGEAAAERALRYLLERAPPSLEPSLTTTAPAAAFNMKTLSVLIGTTLEPDLSGHILMLEDVSEYHYSIDRMFFQITSVPAMRRLAGIRLGRFSAIPPNDPPFGKTVEEIARHWCAVSGIPYLGRADIGHDCDNKIVPFGLSGL
jgi:muramoyltetrapeptide carboxypeptidase